MATETAYSSALIRQDDATADLGPWIRLDQHRAALQAVEAEREPIAAEALAMAEELEGKTPERRFHSIEEIKREFFPALHAEEQNARRESEPPSELDLTPQPDTASQAPRCGGSGQIATRNVGKIEMSGWESCPGCPGCPDCTHKDETTEGKP